MSKDFKILFLGDIVGRPGREIVKKFLEENRANYDFVMVNVENASHGFGLTKKNYEELSETGIDCMTSGNHIWDKKEITQYIDEADKLIRPLNYHKSVQGVGYRIFNDKVVVINLLGKTFMPPINCPFAALESFAEENPDLIKEKIVIIDFHAEATAEKICLGKFAAELGIRGIFGTHTHIQTADEKIIKETCAYITDAGFCGASEGVIGMEYEGSLKHIITAIPERFEVLKKPEKVQINGIEVIYDTKNLNPKSVKRINETFEVNYES